jgi:hypothetical protein
MNKAIYSAIKIVSSDSTKLALGEILADVQLESALAGGDTNLSALKPKLLPPGDQARPGRGVRTEVSACGGVRRHSAADPSAGSASACGPELPEGELGVAK